MEILLKVNLKIRLKQQKKYVSDLLIISNLSFLNKVRLSELHNNLPLTL